MPFVCEGGPALLWVGKKVAGEARGGKGILIAHSVGRPDPGESALYSPKLVEFARTNGLALVSCWDIFRAHALGRKELMEDLWTQAGVVSPEWLAEYRPSNKNGSADLEHA
jgi:hypothetical protein